MGVYYTYLFVAAWWPAESGPTGSLWSRYVKYENSYDYNQK